jgi:hypothetical protein
MMTPPRIVARPASITPEMAAQVAVSETLRPLGLRVLDVGQAA